MKEVLKTNDPVRLSYAQSLLNDADIEGIVLDEGMSTLYGGGLPFIKRRLMVLDEDEVEALRLLAELLPEDE
ncbi:DUF2007 domain-containing protein [uncultured Maricaulis sp.]|uniref:putative signal transducing protein n=1 Tax=uncultured Maricaulis sp. TaxID=174710 RepID=UPI0030DA959D|tara:strand:+ start:70806 stop:71021 length:216 start_codon:yes stop_codon:yes gene_type:complete